MRRVILSLILGVSFYSGAVQANNFVCLYTNVNEFCFRMLSEDAPTTVENFLSYVNSGAYDGTVIHRSVPGFIVQGGGFYRDPLGESVQSLGPIQNEFMVSNSRSTVAMAKAEGNPDSATSQWFVNLTDNSENLDQQNGGFTVFAEVVRGMEIVDAVSGLQRYNLSSIVNNAFSETPGIPVTASDIVLITVLKAQSFETLPEAPYSCSPKGRGASVTEFCGSTITLPVLAGNTMYKVKLELTSTKPAYELTLVPGSLSTIENYGQPYAAFKGAIGELFIPTLKHGNKLYRNMRWQRNNEPGFVFTLQSFD